MRATGRGGTAIGGNASHSAFGQGSQVFDNRQIHIHLTPREVMWPLEIGPVPSLASAFQPRTALCEQVDAARARGSSAMTTQVLSGGGGVGKSQLAAAYATEALHDGTDLVLWVPSVEVQRVVTFYARAAVIVAAPGAGGDDLEQDAWAFLDWLATTDRSWLVVLDDITDPAGMAGWWPTSRTGTGWVLATTRLHDAALTGNGRKRVRVGVYTPDEASAYLRTRLADDDAGHLLDDNVDDLAAALGRLPLALGHAAAYMLNQDLSSARYLTLFNDHSRRLEQVLPETADAEGYGRQITTTLLLSLDAAQLTQPAGLARPALQLAAHLDPAGHPHSVWTTPVVLAHLTERRAPAPDTAEHAADVTTEEAESVLRVLHRYALINSDRQQEPRAVRIHALTARAARETTPAEVLPPLAQTAADALLHVWPSLDQPYPELASALRSNTDHLHHHTGDHLWHPKAHIILFRAGESLIDAGMPSAATTYWDVLVTQSQRICGPEHPDSLTARRALSVSLWKSARTREAIALQESVLADRERLLGPLHMHTLTSRSDLALSYQQTGRINDAVTLQEFVLIGNARTLGHDHPHTITARLNLAGFYADVGRNSEAISLLEVSRVSSERVFGPLHPITLHALNNLAHCYQQAGLEDEALSLREAVLADRERVLGPQHPDTLGARNNVAHSYQQAGRTAEATALLETAVADFERVLGPDHPGTLTARNNLVSSYLLAGRTTEATALQEAIRADLERTRGTDHP
ncbi:tetratricopeptide repeat protein [Streptomyces sp. NPDC058221]|uniref:tetratricopeptide repeat protein n=1 Tax=Streptomyces sp. NPDC058221 TaxID=3346388 RepID=UPI0036EC5C5B